jgi:carboxymethylenebutenolidase
MAGRWDTITADGSDMRCYVAEPSGAGPFPAVIVIQHAGGVDEFVRGMTDRFGSAGFVAVAPDLYHREDPDSKDDPLTRMTRLRDATIIKDVDASVEHAKALPNVQAASLGITGFCMGGRVTYLIATQRSDLKAAVVFYGGNIMRPWGEGPAPFEMTDRIQAPMLGLFGEEDDNPSPDDVKKLDAELTRLAKTHEFHSFSGVGHGFMAAGRPGYRADTADDAWERCTSWFTKYLRA